MSIDLVRVDDRLIHGQVVVGWVRALGAERIVVVDDSVCNSEWERELMTLGVPPELEVVFTSVSDATETLDGWSHDAKCTILLLPDVAGLARLCQGSRAISRVNIGGVHEDVGRTERLSYVYLTDDEAAQLRKLSDNGIAVSAQDVPTARPVGVGDLL